MLTFGREDRIVKRQRKKIRIKGFFKSYISGFLRAALVALLVSAQFAFIFFLAYQLRSAGIYVYFAVELAAFVIIIGLLKTHTNYLFKIGWLSIITLLPIAGLIMYFLWGRERTLRQVRKTGKALLEYGNRFEIPDAEAKDAFIRRFPAGETRMNYLESQGFRLYTDNTFEYFSSGEDAFEAVIEDFENAEKFIFISFFIVAEGGLWERIKPILIDKARAGVEIRFIYDDFGSMFRTDKLFWKELEEAGVRVACFNPIQKYVAKLYLNYRDHQKIIVIDGNIGYTGGFNLADEYINAIERFGYWKDGGVRIYGPGVFGITRIFLDMWGITMGSNSEDYDRFRPDAVFEKADRFCQCISDGPINYKSNPIEASITQMVYNASDFMYITTPYLILEDSLSEALCIQAKAGTDVRLIIPGIPDKKGVYELTKYNCGKLLENGVRVFVYTPGFVHNKTYVTRDCALVGSINTDFRSFYLHFECGTFIWDNDLVNEIVNDYKETFDQCHEMTYEEWRNRPVMEKIKQYILNIFAALA